jgi:restriction system protein
MNLKCNNLRIDKAMKNYYRIMLGQKSSYAQQAYEGNYIGADYGIKSDLSNYLFDRREFSKKFIPQFLENHPGKTKVSAGLACGMLWTITKGLQQGDIVLCPDGHGGYYVGEVAGVYEYHKDKTLLHRRSVRWFPRIISRDEISESLKNSAGSIGTVSNISKYAAEIDALISGIQPTLIVSTDETIENPSEFALEKHLEDFLIQNWKSTELGKLYDVYEDEGEIVGQQYPSDTGLIDILARSKDKKTIVVIELKKGRASDVVVGQVQRYMGFVKEELAEVNQSVRGIIIAFEDDVKIKRALAVAPNIEFYTYKINFKLEKR